MRNVLITGGRGFMGRGLAPCLTAREYSVSIWDLPTHTVLDYDSLEKFCQLREIDTIYHLAAVMGTGVLNDWGPSLGATRTNIIGILNVLEVARKIGAKVIYLGKPNACNTYSITKTAAQGFCEMFHKEHQVPVVILIGYNIYGEGQPEDKMVPRLLKRALVHEEITIYGDGEQTVDLIHRDDVVAALARAGEVDAAVGKTIEVGTGVETTVNEITALVVQLTESKSAIRHVPMRGGEEAGAKIRADPRLLKDLLGITPSTDLVSNLRKIIHG